MSNTQTIKRTCHNCGAVSDGKIYLSINTAVDPELKDSVKSGALFTWTCEKCGAVNLLKYQTLYHDPQQRIMIWLTDGDLSSAENIQRLFQDSDELKDYTARIVRDAGSMIEKVKIFDAGLDDVAMEICKLVTCSELDKDVEMKFFRLDGPDNEITFTYPENGKMELVAVGFNVYEDARSIVSRNPELQKSGKGFFCVDKEWISSIIG